MKKIFLWKNLRGLSLIFICTLLIIGFWKAYLFLIPCILIIGFWLLYDWNSDKPFLINKLNFALILLIGFETLNYLTSQYRPNSLLFLFDLIVIVGVASIFKRVLADKIYILFVVFIIAFIFTTLNLGLFFFTFFESSYYGFDDFSQLRFLYTPMSFVSNEWVTLLLCFLPFTIICLFAIQNKKLIETHKILANPVFKVIISLAIGLILFNLFISFSRGGYLAFAVFLFLFNLLFIVNRIIPVKKIIIGNLILIFFCLILSYCFYPTIKSTFGQTLSHKRSTEGRIKQWSSTKDIMRTYPLLGVGAKNYTLVNSIYKNKHIEQPFTGRVNNSYIQILTEKGIIGLGVYCIIFLVFIYNSFNKILKTEDIEEKTTAIIIFVSVIAILIRELFFSSIFYNNNILLLLLILFIINSDNSVEFLVPSKYKYPIIILAYSLYSTIIFFYVEQLNNDKIYNNYILKFNEENFDSALNFISKAVNNSKNNALYESSLGLTLERKISRNKEFDFADEYRFTSIDCELLTRSISKYKKACELNPYDAFYLNNLGWLYFMENQADSAINCISQAITVDPTIALFHISKGLMMERNDVVRAFDEYKKALILSPDILDSRFFNNLESKNPEKSNILVNQVYNELHILQLQNDSPIIKARMGRVMLELNKVDSAYYIFKEVTCELPNLNRAWYNLGLICEKKGMTIDMLVCYQKSIYLDFKDYLPKYKLAKYYDQIKDVRNALYYHRTARRCWLDRLSEHSFRSKKIYYLETVKDDIIPNGFNQYIIPDTLVIDKKHKNY